jgi:tRNA 2-thiouridine synthesizing protein A
MEAAMTDADGAASARLTVDARGLNCPLPLLKLKRAAATHPGAVELALLTTDEDSVADVDKFARHAGYRLSVARDAAGVITCRLTRG